MVYLKESEEDLRMRVEDTVFYNYTAAPFPLDRYFKANFLTVTSKYY